MIEVGTDIPELTFGPIDRTLLALFAGASGDHNPIHIDSDFARAAGQPDVFGHGMLSFGILARAVTAWSGQARLRSLDIRFMSIARIGDVLRCRGRIAERITWEGEACLRISLEAVSQAGERVLSGEAIVAER